MPQRLQLSHSSSEDEIPHLIALVAVPGLSRPNPANRVSRREPPLRTACCEDVRREHHYILRCHSNVLHSTQDARDGQNKRH